MKDALHAAFNEFGHAVVLLTDTGVVVQANEAAAQLVGRTAADLAGGRLCPFMLEEDGSAPAIEFLNEVVSAKQSGEREILRAGHCWEVHLARLPDHRMLLLALDITEKKREQVARLVQEQKRARMLIRETHHRLKNELQGLIGLVRTHSDTQRSTRDVIDGVVAQILSIASLHGLLARDELGAIELSELVMQIMDGLRGSSAVPLEFVLMPQEWRPTSLPQEEGTVFAIIVGEMCMNAIKHTQEVHGAYVRARLARSDDDIDFVVSNSPASLPQHFELTGLELVRALMPRDRSHLEITQDGNAVTTHLRLKAPKALN